MSADEEPIGVSPPVIHNLDVRLAELYVSTLENRPKEPTMSLTLKGHIALGESSIQGLSGRPYRIAVRQAFLAVLPSTGCQFDPNPAIDDFVQRGRLVDQRISGTEGDISFGGDVSTSNKGVVVRAKGALQRHQKRKVDTHVDRVRARYVAGGFRIGENTGGDPVSSSDILDGTYLRGLWGELHPSSSVRQYGILLKLLVPDGMLSVTPLHHKMSDRFPTAKKKSHNDGFDALKRAVAGWVIERHLRSANATDGYDKERNELLLCQAELDVDLSKVAAADNATDTISTIPTYTAILDSGKRSREENSPKTKPVKKNKR
ncbi:hypothetical protein [Bradyrhizobium sp. STM 3809]|uniref:hypothetical protein n=1 Tax=Bradyrhizobium sp. STM 3809 TaxID=551936 RepID=UPI001111EB10|nr:hypothetical protein [Bradyrhizobium sp. STM 3809]